MNRQLHYHRLLLVPIVSLLSVALLFWARTQTADGLQLLPLTLNPFALFSIFAVLINSALFVIISRIKHKSPAALWYLLFLASLIIWGFCQSMQRLSPHAEAALFWSGLAIVGVSIMPAAFLMFSIHYSYANGLDRQSLTWVTIMVSVAALVYFNVSTDLLNVRQVDQVELAPWGYFAANGPYFWVMVLWIEAFFISSLSILIKHYRTNKDALHRRQTRLFIISLLIPLIIGSATDGILPLFGVVLLPTAILFTSIGAIIVGYGIRKYSLFSLNQGTIADNILRSMNEGVIVTDAAFLIQSVNRGGERTLGETEHNLLGRPISEIFSPSTLKTIEPMMESHFKNKPFIKIAECDIQRNDREPVSVSLSVTQVEIDQNTSGHIFVFTDISELKAKQKELELAKIDVEKEVVIRTSQLRNAQARLEASINSLNNGFIMIDAHQKLLTINAVAKSLLTDASLRPINYAEEWTLETIASTAAGQLDIRSKVASVIKERRPVEEKGINIGKKIIDLYINPVTDSVQVIGCLVTLEDVTEARVLERSKNEFFSIASHELRTPLAAIRGNASLILTYLKDFIPDKVIIESIEDIHSSSVRLTDIVNDFLDVSRSEQGKIEYNPTSLNIFSIANEVIHEVKGLATDKGLYLKIDESSEKEAMVIADLKRAKQVILNLISNAITYSETGGITVHIKTVNQVVEIRVKDTGKGIPQEKFSLLFRKFQQAGDSILTRETSKGTGLGLYISRILAQGMGGSLQIESSTPGKGTTFLFVLPKAVTTPSIKQ